MEKNDIDFSIAEKELKEDIKIKVNRGRFINYLILSYITMNKFAQTSDIKDFEKAKKYLNALLDMIE